MIRRASLVAGVVSWSCLSQGALAQSEGDVAAAPKEEASQQSAQPSQEAPAEEPSGPAEQEPTAEPVAESKEAFAEPSVEGPEAEDETSPEESEPSAEEEAKKEELDAVLSEPELPSEPKDLKDPDKREDPNRSRKAAQNLKKVEAAIEARDYEPWEDIKDTKFDWLRTSSGEWLKGELKDLRDDSITLDSDEFDLQTLDFEDVIDLHLPNRFIFVLDDNSTYAGPADLADGKLVVHTDEGKRVFEKKRLMTIVPENVSEISKWYYKLTLGASTRRGNTDTVDYTAYSRLRREDAFNRATLTYNGAYGLVSDEVNTHRHSGNLTWNIYMSPVFYLSPIYADGLFDRFQNIKFRGVAASGGGVHIVNKSDVSLDFELAAGYANTHFLSVEAGEPVYQDGMVGVPRIVFDWDITGDIEFEASWTSSLVLTDFTQSFHHGDARLEIDITDIFDFDVSVAYDRVESPVTDEEGETPVKDDVATTLGVGLEFD